MLEGQMELLNADGEQTALKTTEEVKVDIFTLFSVSYPHKNKNKIKFVSTIV